MSRGGVNSDTQIGEDVPQQVVEHVERVTSNSEPVISIGRESQTEKEDTYVYQTQDQLHGSVDTQFLVVKKDKK